MGSILPPGTIAGRFAIAGWTRGGAGATLTWGGREYDTEGRLGIVVPARGPVGMPDGPVGTTGVIGDGDGVGRLSDAGALGVESGA